MSNRPRSAHDTPPTYVGSSFHPDSFFERLKRGLPPKYIETSAHPDSFFERLKRGLPPKYIETSAHPDSFFERLKRGLPPKYIETSAHPDSFFERLKRGLPADPNSTSPTAAGASDEEAQCDADDAEACEIADECGFSGWDHAREVDPPVSQGGGGAVEGGA